MSNYCDVNMTVKHFPIDNIDDLTEFMYGNDEYDFAFAFNESQPEVYGEDICFFGMNPINRGIAWEDMEKLSEKFPDATFLLDSKDEFGEQWREYWRNGKMASYTPEIVWPEFDENDLKEVTSY